MMRGVGFDSDQEVLAHFETESLSEGIHIFHEYSGYLVHIGTHYFDSILSVETIRRIKKYRQLESPCCPDVTKPVFVARTPASSLLTLSAIHGVGPDPNAIDMYW